MGYDFFTLNPSGNVCEPNASDYACWNIHSWRMLLQLAEFYGWKPAGTIDPVIESDDANEIAKTQKEWDGGYFWNQGQTVVATDALNLASALEKALDDIPNNVMPPKLITVRPDEISESNNPVSQIAREILGNEEEVTMPNIYLSAYEYFGGDTKNKVVNFIAFCRKGAFLIW